MRKIIIALAVLLIGAGFILWDLQSSPPGNIVDEKQIAIRNAPNVSLTDIDGKTFKLHDFEGKSVLLNIWATWCTPCIAEMPQLLQLSQRHKNKMVFIALSTDRDIETIRAFFDKLPADVRPYVFAENVIFAHDPDMRVSMGVFKTKMYPESFIINKHMEIVKRVPGVIDWLGHDVEVMLFRTGNK